MGCEVLLVPQLHAGSWHPGLSHSRTLITLVHLLRSSKVSRHFCITGDYFFILGEPPGFDSLQVKQECVSVKKLLPVERRRGLLPLVGREDIGPLMQFY